MTYPNTPSSFRRRRGVRRTASVAVVLAVAALSSATPAAGGPAGDAPRTEIPETPAAVVKAVALARTITLITGDTVTVTGDQRPVVAPGPGREGITFVVLKENGRITVLPSDARALVEAGKVDPRLFDVTTLLEQGLDRQPTLPLIVGATSDRAVSSARDTVTDQGARAGRELEAIDGVVVRTKDANATELWDGLTGRTTAAEAEPKALLKGIGTVWLDGVSKVTLESSVPQIGAPIAWEAGYDGTGIKVAVLDTGIDAEHPDMVGQVVAFKDFVDAGPGDAYGHGTHVASIVAGTGAASDGKFRGVAPGAKLIDGKICNELGECPESATIEAMQWAAVDMDADVVNMSLGGSDAPGIDPKEAAVNTLSEEHGTLFVVSAGNAYQAPFSVASPGSADAALTVGSVDDQDALADHSSVGPRMGDRAIKPDIAAPGDEITAARASTNIIPDGGSGPYMTISGTSMAAPHVAGASAILMQRRPEAGGEQVKRLLMSSSKAVDNAGSYDQGSGRVDVARAIKQTVTSLGNVYLGQQTFPHTDDEPLTGTIGYRNYGDQAVTLTLIPSTTAPDRTAGPSDALTLDASTVTVPAGGTATVGVNWLLPADAPPGDWSGRVVASADGVQVQTALAMYQQEEAYPVTIKQIGLDGEPPSDADAFLYYSSYDASESGFLPASQESITLTAGTYHIFSAMDQQVGQRIDEVVMVSRGVTVTGPTSVTFDAREARKVDVRVPRRGATPVHMAVGTDFRAPEGLWVGLALGSGPGQGMRTADVLEDGETSAPRSDVSFTSMLGGAWGRPDAGLNFASSPYMYHGAWYKKDLMFTGLRRTLSDDKVATVKTQFGRNKLDQGLTTTISNLPGVWESGMLVRPQPVDLPLRRVDKYASDGRLVTWERDFVEDLETDAFPPGAQVYTQPFPEVYQAGRTYHDSWNVPVYGPATAPASTFPEQAFFGDELFIGPTLTGDAAGHLGYHVALDAARLRISRDGEVLFDEEAQFAPRLTLPDRKPADYRVRASVDRSSTADLSTKVNTVWTFRSTPPATGDDRVDLPVSVVRFRPAVDLTGHLPSRGALRIPVTVTRQGDAGRARLLLVRMSTDDGATWSAPRDVRLRGQQGVAVFPASVATRGYISLRALSVDSHNSSVRQTVIRAFRR